jgi:hypothetical protein
MLAQRPKLSATQGMHGGRAILDPAGEFDLLPSQINNLPSAQSMPECEEDR